jgi:hypothetical protein
MITTTTTTTTITTIISPSCTSLCAPRTPSRSGCKKKEKKGRIKKNEQSETRTILLGMAIRAVAAKKKEKKSKKKKAVRDAHHTLGQGNPRQASCTIFIPFFLSFFRTPPPP